MEETKNKCCALCGSSTRKERALLCLCQNSDMYLDLVDEKLCCKHFSHREDKNIAKSTRTGQARS